MAIYAISPVSVGDVTTGKKYPVSEWGVGAFHICDDAGDQILCLWEGCAFIEGRDWQRVEEPDTPAADFRSMSGHELADWAVSNGLAGGCAEEIAGRFVTENIKTTTGSRDFRDYFTNKENPNHA